MQLTELTKLLKYSNGQAEVTRDEPLARRAIPSGGGLYPTELYVLPLDIPALGLGAFHYEVSTHSLARFIDAPAEPILARACYTEAALPTASVAFVISACFERQRIKYGERAYRFALLECGHLAQNLLLMGTAMGLGTLAVGGFLDDDINGYLHLNGHQEAAVYVILMGSSLTRTSLHAKDIRLRQRQRNSPAAPENSAAFSRKEFKRSAGVFLDTLSALAYKEIKNACFNSFEERRQTVGRLCPRKGCARLVGQESARWISRAERRNHAR
jgi:SagB-type dehydrogenase family enzyme